MNITFINGSPSKNSKTFALLKYLEQLLIGKNIQVTLYDLREKSIPIVMPEFHKNPIDSPNKSVKEFVKVIENSHGIILGTPLYHGSYSGILKNALDNLAYDAFRNKVIGIVSCAGGGRIPNANEHLSTVVRTMYGYSTQTHIASCYEDYQIVDEKYLLKNNDIKERCERLSNELIHLCNLHSNYAIT